MYGIVVLLSVIAAVAHANHESDARLLDRLDLKNYKKFASEREHTSTDSTDSSSDAKRIALAVEAALKEAALAEKFTPAPAVAASRVKTFRLRLSTVNKPKTCAFFSCDDVDAVTDDESVIAGASVTATVLDANVTRVFTTRFNAAGVATNPNDLFQFKLTFDVTDGLGSFTLTTVPGEFGVNITSITVTTQGLNRAVNSLIYFDPLGSDTWQAGTPNLLKADNNIRLVNGSAIIGCDANFDGHSNSGVTSFTINTNTAFLVDDKVSQTFSFAVRVNAINVQAPRNAIYKKLGLDLLPCSTRARAIYDEITIVTKRANPIGFGDDTLEHPLVYDELKSQTTKTAPTFDELIRQLQLAAGRTQLRLRDITLDRGAFSDLSHQSKFTPCFRVYPDSDGAVEVFIGQRFTSGSGIVRSLLDVEPLLDTDGTLKSFDELTSVPKFETSEIVFSTLGLSDSDSSVEGANSRRFLSIASDVTVQLESCPDFSYFA